MLSGSSGRLRPIALAIAVMITAQFLVGCERFYNLTIENYSNKPVTVHFEIGEYKVASCSVLAFASVSGPGLGKLFIEATDADGNPVNMAASFEDEAKVYLLLQIGDVKRNLCAPPKDEFKLYVLNHSSKVIYMWLGDEQLGPVPINKSRDFGTIPSGWRRARELQMRDAQGEILTEADAVGGGSSVSFAIGETPEIRWRIGDGLAQPTRRPSPTITRSVGGQ